MLGTSLESLNSANGVVSESVHHSDEEFDSTAIHIALWKRNMIHVQGLMHIKAPKP